MGDRKKERHMEREICRVPTCLSQLGEHVESFISRGPTESMNNAWIKPLIL